MDPFNQQHVAKNRQQCSCPHCEHFRKKYKPVVDSYHTQRKPIANNPRNYSKKKNRPKKLVASRWMNPPQDVCDEEEIPKEAFPICRCQPSSRQPEESVAAYKYENKRETPAQPPEDDSLLSLLTAKTNDDDKRSLRDIFNDSLEDVREKQEVGFNGGTTLKQEPVDSSRRATSPQPAFTDFNGAATIKKEPVDSSRRATSPQPAFTDFNGAATIKKEPVDSSRRATSPQPAFTDFNGAATIKKEPVDTSRRATSPQPAFTDFNGAATIKKEPVDSSRRATSPQQAFTDFNGAATIKKEPVDSSRRATSPQPAFTDFNGAATIKKEPVDSSRRATSPQQAFTDFNGAATIKKEPVDSSRRDFNGGTTQQQEPVEIDSRTTSTEALSFEPPLSLAEHTKTSLLAQYDSSIITGQIGKTTRGNSPFRVHDADESKSGPQNGAAPVYPRSLESGMNTGLGYNSGAASNSLRRAQTLPSSGIRKTQDSPSLMSTTSKSNKGVTTFVEPTEVRNKLYSGEEDLGKTLKSVSRTEISKYTFSTNDNCGNKNEGSITIRINRHIMNQRARESAIMRLISMSGEQEELRIEDARVAVLEKRVDGCTWGINVYKSQSTWTEEYFLRSKLNEFIALDLKRDINQQHPLLRRQGHEIRVNKEGIQVKMTEEVRLLFPQQDLAARRHFFEEVATGGNRFHRSTPATPLAAHRETIATDASSLTVGVVLEKCLSENSLLMAADKQTSSTSKSDSDISSINAPAHDEYLDEEADGLNPTHPTEDDSSGGGGEEPKMTGATGDPSANNEGLIAPKKLQNPCLESQDRQRLHKELMLNQKLGKNVLNQKSELQRAMEKYKDTQFRKELEQQRQENMSPLERVIEQRAKRLEILERNALNEKDISPKEPEFLQIHAKLRARMDAK